MLQCPEIYVFPRDLGVVSLHSWLLDRPVWGLQEMTKDKHTQRHGQQAGLSDGRTAALWKLSMFITEELDREVGL